MEQKGEQPVEAKAPAKTQKNGSAKTRKAAWVKFQPFAEKGIDGDKVIQAMKTFGTVDENASIIKRGFVEVRFENDEDLAKAIATGSVTIGDTAITVEALKGKTGARNRRSGGGGGGGGAAAGAKGEKGGSDKKVSEDVSVYVNGVPADTSKEQILECFSPYGEVRDVEVRKRKLKTGNAIYVFVNFEEKAGADAALEAATSAGISLNGEPLTVERRKPKETREPKSKKNAPEVKPPKQLKTVYVSNMAHGVDEEKLRSTFEPFGTIKQITLRQRDCFASVEFTTAESVASAHAACASNPLQYNGKPLVAEPWKSKQDDEALSKTLHIAGFGASVPTVDEVRSMVEQFGETVEVLIRPMRKFALIAFTESEPAAQAVAKAQDGGLGIEALEGTSVKVELSITQRKRKPRHRPNRRTRKENVAE